MKYAGGLTRTYARDLEALPPTEEGFESVASAADLAMYAVLREDARDRRRSRELARAEA